MRLLLDTHAFLWFVRNDSKLSDPARAALAAAENEIMLSPANYWELAIKVQLGKYQLNVPFDEFVAQAIERYDLTILPIKPTHAAVVSGLPNHHRDPFDRLIIAQAMVEQVAVVSADRAFDAYSVGRLW